MRRIAVPCALLVLPLPVVADPVALGAALYAEHCTACHLETGEGEDSAADVRGVSKSALMRALGGIDAMPEFDFTDAEAAALHAFLQRLDAPE